MKCGEPGTIGGNSGAQQKIGDAILHFLGGFIGEGDGENAFGGRAACDEVGHAERNGASLAGASASEDENGTLGGFGGETLFGIQGVEKVLH